MAAQKKKKAQKKTTADDDGPFERDPLGCSRDPPGLPWRILVTPSGGLVVGAAAVAVGVFPRRTRSERRRGKVADGIARGEAVTFSYPSSGDHWRDRGAAAERPARRVLVDLHPPRVRVPLGARGGMRRSSVRATTDGSPPRPARCSRGRRRAPCPWIKLEDRAHGIYAVQAKMP